MKTKIFLITLFAIFIFKQPAWSAENPTSFCWATPTVISELPKEKAQALFKALPKDKQDELLTAGNYLHVFEADINNDGKIKEVFIGNSNAGEGEPIQKILILDPSTKSYIKAPFDLDKTSSAKSYLYEFYGFLKKLCGKTYITFQNNYPHFHRDRYFWKNGVAQYACDKDWMNYERQQFQKNYMRGYYSYNQLDFYINNCKNEIKPQDFFWIKNDIALATYKANDSKQCLYKLAEIENDPAFSKAPDNLKKSVAFNKTKCTQLRASVPWIIYTEGDGKGSYKYFVSQTVDLKTLSNTFYRVEYFDILPQDIDKNKKTMVSYIGKINGIKVYDVLYPLVDDGLNLEYLKAIYLEKKPNRFIPVYYTTVDKNTINSTEDLKGIKSFILADKNLVVSRVPMSGNGGYVYNMSLYVPPDILSNKNQIPHILNKELNERFSER